MHLYSTDNFFFKCIINSIVDRNFCFRAISVYTLEYIFICLLFTQIPRCIACPAGYSCQDAKIPPVSCQKGYYSSGGNSSCLPCPEGYSCLDPAKTPVSCTVGQYSLSVCFNCIFVGFSYRSFLKYCIRLITLDCDVGV